MLHALDMEIWEHAPCRKLLKPCPYLERVLTENYEGVKLMVDGYPPHPPRITPWNVSLDTINESD